MTVFIPERRKRLRELLKLATRGEWEVVSKVEAVNEGKFLYAPTCGFSIAVSEGLVVRGVKLGDGDYAGVLSTEDAQLIAEAVNAIEPLLNYIETLERHIDLIEGGL